MHSALENYPPSHRTCGYVGMWEYFICEMSSRKNSAIHTYNPCHYGWYKKRSAQNFDYDPPNDVTITLCRPTVCMLCALSSHGYDNNKDCNHVFTSPSFPRFAPVSDLRTHKFVILTLAIQRTECPLSHVAHLLLPRRLVRPSSVCVTVHTCARGQVGRCTLQCIRENGKLCACIVSVR